MTPEEREDAENREMADTDMENRDTQDDELDEEGWNLATSDYEDILNVVNDSLKEFGLEIEFNHEGIGDSVRWRIIKSKPSEGTPEGTPEKSEEPPNVYTDFHNRRISRMEQTQKNIHKTLLEIWKRK